MNGDQIAGQIYYNSGGSDPQEWTGQKNADGTFQSTLFAGSTLNFTDAGLRIQDSEATHTAKPISQSTFEAHQSGATVPEAASSPAASAADDAIQKTGSFVLTDRDGYFLTVKYSFSVGTPTSDAADSLPGQTEVTIPGQLTATVTNTTAGHNVTIDPLYVVPYGLYAANSLACTVAKQDDRPNTLPGGDCLVLLGPSLAWDGANTTLTMGQADQQTTAVVADNPLYQAALSVKEGQAPQLIAALEQPEQFVLIGSGDGARWTDKTSCSITYDTIVGSTTAPTYDAAKGSLCT